jgi:hypothetical protein
VLTSFGFLIPVTDATLTPTNDLHKLKSSSWWWQIFVASACHEGALDIVLFAYWLSHYYSLSLLAFLLIVHLTSLAMKFSAILFASLVAASYGFSPIMKSKTSTSLFVEPTSGPVDKTMKGIDSDPNTFDPTGGANPALTRNNKGEVWNLQVSRRCMDFVMEHAHSAERICRSILHYVPELDRA